jgi:hypothetical protein
VVATLLAGNCLETARDLLTHYLQHTRHPKSHYGLIYSDENGALPPFALLGDYARHLPHLDILIHVAATPIKRQRLSPNHPLSERLDELMATIAKEQWIVRQPYGHHQWSFLIGTNWDAFPRFKRQGFWPVSSPEGARILRILSWTTQERSDHEQQNLFPEERP